MKMNKLIVIVCGLAACGWVNAQVPNICPLPPDPDHCMLLYSWDDLPSNLPKGTVCCTPPGGAMFNTYCNVPTKACKVSAKETCLSCNQGKTAQAASPIDLATGNTYISQLDINIPGLGGGLSLARTWNSLLPVTWTAYLGMFGINWRSNYEERLVYSGPDGYLKYARGDGSVWTFGVSTVGSPNVYQPMAPANDTTTITEGSPSWTLTAKSGEKRLFDATSGRLLSIVDRNGNTTQLAYDSSNRLISVTDPASRHLYFNYSGSSTLVSSVTSDVGITLSYTYDTNARLTQVTKPDNTTVSFVYDSQNRITTVNDSNGKVLESHTYDAAGRGLTSSRANGVDAVTVTYPQ
jgi:YD repeat-containing protein